MSASGECEEELVVNNGCLMWHNNELAHTVLMLCPAVTLRQDCRVVLSKGHRRQVTVSLLHTIIRIVNGMAVSV